AETSVALLLQAGQKLAEDRERFSQYGQWGPYLKEADLDEDKALRLISIGRNPALNNPARWGVLPPHYSTLYELSRIGSEKLNRIIEAGGRVYPEMGRRAAEKLVKLQRYEQERDKQDADEGQENDEGRDRQENDEGRDRIQEIKDRLDT